MEKFLSKNAKILVILATILGALSGPLGRTITAPALAIGFWRLTMGIPFFAVPVLLNKEKRNEFLGLRGHNLKWTLIAGMFLFFHFFSWFSSVKMTNITSASVMAALSPIVVLFISIVIYKRKIGFKAIVGIVIALIGGAITAGLDYAELASGYFLGDIVGLLAGFFIGIYYSIGDKIRDKVNGQVYVLVLFISCWACFLIAMIVSGTPFFSYPAKDWGLLVLMTLACQIGCHALNNLCLGHTDSVYVSAWGTSEPLFATVFAFLMIGQTPTKWSIVGCAIVILGLLYYNFNSKDFKNEYNEEPLTSKTGSL